MVLVSLKQAARLTGLGKTSLSMASKVAGYLPPGPTWVRMKSTLASCTGSTRYHPKSLRSRWTPVSVTGVLVQDATPDVTPVLEAQLMPYARSLNYFGNSWMT